jgi:hypothetical protein
MDDLHRDGAAQLRVGRAPDLGHAAASEQRLEAVTPSIRASRLIT